ncbi:MAG: hydrogenase iron-sulfur subunit, partial [Caldisericia bacterium]|nr:hydrogenase iron-sulfur subunit [Caldisericia bacterium]
KICGICEKLCTQGAINFEDKEELISFNVDTIITATGYELFDPEKKPVYGFGKYSNVLTALQLERIIATGSSGPPLKPIGKRVAFIQCVGSRDEQVDRENCSRICCMYATKLAQLLKRLDPSRDIYIFYTDLRAYGKGFEEYYKRAQNAGIKYIRGRVAEIREDSQSKKLHILSEDTLSRKMIEGEFDLVVLSTGIVPSSGSEQIADILKLARSADGFLQEAHPKFRPVDTLIDGVFIAGCAQGPKDIPDSVAQGSASASRAMRLMNKGVFEIEPIIAFVHNDICDGCGLCINSCPLKAISIENGKAKINEVICKGCGMCIADCPNDALDLRYYTNKQLMEQIDEALKTKKEGETRILVFADNTCTYRLADNIGTARLSYPAETRIIRVPSVSRITPKLLLYAFKSGADGIFMGECDNRASPYTGSVDKIKKNVSLVKEILKKEGISEERLKFAELLASLLTDFYKHITELTKFLKKEEPISIEKRERLWEIAKNELFSERVEA